MELEQVKQIVGDTPHMSWAQAQTMAKFIHEQPIKDIIELGFRHGVSTCYMASALSAKGEGSIITIDLEQNRGATPNIEQLLESCGERDRVAIYYEPTSYNWRLMKLLEEDATPRFDLCYLDGAHNWFVDGLAFYLVDRLLRPGGWIILDDLNWTIAGSRALRDSEWAKNLPPEETTTPQVRKVYELLIKTHPSYTDFQTHGSWGFSRKSNTSVNGVPDIRREVVTERVHVGLGATLARAFRTARAGSRKNNRGS